MIFANPFESTKKSMLNVSAKIIEVINKENINNFEKVIYMVENSLNISYEKVILALNFLYMIGAIKYDKKRDILEVNYEI